MTDRLTYVIVPAASGFEVLEYFHNGGGADACIDRQPVVAWRVPIADDYEYAEPVTPGTFDRTHEHFIKYPDGRVVWPACQTWDNEAEWLVSVAARAEEKARKAS